MMVNRGVINNLLDKVEGLETELHELVLMIFRAKDLDRLKETTALNFPEEYERYKEEVK